MKNAFFLFLAAFCLLSQSCHRPVALFQHTPHVSARTPITSAQPTPATFVTDSLSTENESTTDTLVAVTQAVASLKHAPTAQSATTRLQQRTHRIQSMLRTPTQTVDQQPRPKPKKKLKLGNRIRETLGVPLRDELNWWQRISWKLKAAVVVLLVAVVFALLKITILAIIFGVVAAFLLISGLRRSFKTRRPWF